MIVVGVLRAGGLRSGIEETTCQQAARNRLSAYNSGDMRISRLVGLVAIGACSTGVAAAAATVQFNRDIRPIFSENCFACHGPDASKRMTALRLDIKDGTKVTLSGDRTALVPGDPNASELYARISTGDTARRMPPAAAGHDRLSDPEIELIRLWIEQGAEWQGHWAFQRPQRPEVPADRYPGWPTNPVDSFVLRKLRAERLEPSAPASRDTLIRRVSLDLTGVPPTLAEVDSFLADTSPDSYESVVDRLLSSPGYAERMAIRWLDAARYADTNGYQTDAARDMWRWRDWVIDAFAANKAFDEFTIEQIAGDMLPNPSLSQIVATGFNRNHRGNGEGGIVDAEYAVEYVVDRIDTTATVWLGLTLGCARCHDHKYDPVTQTEYYEIFAYFNNVPEKGKAFKYGNSPPFIKAPTRDQEQRLAELDAQLASLVEQRDTVLDSEARKQVHWADRLADRRSDWVDPMDLALAFPPGATGPDPSERDFDEGGFAEFGDKADFGYYDRFSATAWIRPEDANGAIISKTGHIAGEDNTQSNPGWGFYLADGRLQVNLVNRWLDDCLRVESKDPILLGDWVHVGFTYDGTRLASGLRIYVNGQSVELNVIRDEMNQEIKSKEPLRVGRGLGLDYRGRMRRLLLYERALTAREVEVLAVGRSLDEIARIAPADRNSSEAQKLREAYLNTLGPQVVTRLTARIRNLQRDRQRYLDNVPTVMVMQEMEPSRRTYRLDRGAYDAPAEEVFPGLPSALANHDPENRLGFARWLVSRDNPLTARVTANRFWQMLWGSGIVQTVEDFGAQGEWPTHPDLLDWLAVEFMDSGWDMKALVKTIVMSSAYRQSSRSRPALLERDPQNRLFARGPRLRLPAESVRDLSLAVSGLLVNTVGGRSVMPYQPAGLWSELAGGKDYPVGSGADLYRRSLYTFWKRAVPPPSMILFDSAGREACTVRSVRTNTPLQALNRMNDSSYLEASRALARRTLEESGAGWEQRLRHLFRLVMARYPSSMELEVLTAGFEHHLDRFRNDPQAAMALLGPNREQTGGGVSDPETAALAIMASLVLNLDETITRE